MLLFTALIGTIKRLVILLFSEVTFVRKDHITLLKDIGDDFIPIIVMMDKHTIGVKI